jgi:methyl-accepting chemotaxis protein
MSWNRHRTLVPTVLVASALAVTAAAQPAGPGGPRVPEPSIDALTAQDRDVLATAEQLASDTAQTIEQWIITQATTEDRVFSRLYFPTPRTDPQKYTTPYDALADRDLVGMEDRALARSSAFHYAIATDINGYVPAHNTRFAQPLTGDLTRDYVDNRTKRLLGDLASLAAARGETRFLLQRVRLETGDTIHDLSVPIVVRGKHWGCIRIGYRRTN